VKEPSINMRESQWLLVIGYWYFDISMHKSTYSNCFNVKYSIVSCRKGFYHLKQCVTVLYKMLMSIS